MNRVFDRSLLLDSAIAVVLAAATVITSVPSTGGDRPLNAWGYTLIAVTALLLAIRRHFPLTTLIAVFIGTALYSFLGFPYGPIFVLPAVAIGTVAAYVPVRVSVIACAALIIAYLPYTLLTSSGSAVVNTVIGAVWLVLATLTGVAFQQARIARIETRDAERERDINAQRLAMARDVHDIIGHGLAVINMHAGVASHVIARDNIVVPADVASSLTTIREAGIAALDELGAALSRESMDASRRGIDDIPALIAAVSNEGLRTSCEIEATHRVPETISTTAFRIVQEAVTNVLKHARASHLTVTVTDKSGVVTVNITDNGRGSPRLKVTGQPEPKTAHHGITGMRRRTESLGGVFKAGQDPSGTGFTVTAHLPYGKVTAT